MYRRYFDNYVPLQPTPDLRLPKISPVAEAEVNGYFMLCASQYLYSKKFAPQLISALLIQLRKEYPTLELNNCLFSEEEKPTAVPNEDDESSIWYNPHKVKEMIVKKIDEICLKYENEYSSQDLELQPSENQKIFDIQYATIRNRRRTLEDRFMAIPFLDRVFDDSVPVPASYFGVFDGHNGSDAASYAAAHLHHNLVVLEHFPDEVEKALTEAFVTTDDEFVTKCGKTGDQSGTTVLVALFLQNSLYVAWAGDSEAVLCVKDKEPQVLVKPHKPENKDETARITGAGGSVTNGRVNGILAVSRAIGDVELKEFVCPNPDITKVELTGEEDFLILATDGLWDELPASHCVLVVKEYVLQYGTSAGLSQKLANDAEFFGSTDNTTVIIIFFKPISQLQVQYTAEAAANEAEDEAARDRDEFGKKSPEDEIQMDPEPESKPECSGKPGPSSTSRAGGETGPDSLPAAFGSAMDLEPRPSTTNSARFVQPDPEPEPESVTVEPEPVNVRGPSRPGPSRLFTRPTHPVPQPAPTSNGSGHSSDDE